MKNHAKSGIELYKNLVKSGSNIGAITDSIKNAFTIEPKIAIKWFEELSKEHNSKVWYYIQHSLFELLPSITKISKRSGVRIFSNLLTPEFEEEPSIISYEKPTIRPMRNMHDFWIANQKIIELFRLAPKEFFKAVFELVLIYHNIPKRLKKKGIQDVFSAIWYYDDSYDEEVSLLKSLEREACQLAAQNDSRIKEIFNYLEKTPISLAIKIHVNILLTRPKYYRNKLFDLATTKVISVDDCMNLFPTIINAIKYYMTAFQIKKLNQLVLSTPVPKDFIIDEGSYRKFLALAIPQQIRTQKIKDWLKHEGALYKTLEQRERPFVYTTYEESEAKKQEFSKLSIAEQEKELRHSIEIISGITKKDDKLDLLKNIETYLNNDKAKIKKDLVLLLEPLIWKFCEDSDPEGEYSLDDQKIKYSLISYPSVRAEAASCLLPLTWHNTTPKNIELVEKMSNDRHSFVRESVCRNLRYLSAADYPTSLKLAQKFVEDNRRVHFFLADFLRFNVRKHPEDILEICKKFIEKEGKIKDVPEQDVILGFVVSIVTQMALRIKDKNFEELFEELVNDDSYNYAVKHQIAFTCKDDDILFDNQIRQKIINVYLHLVTNKDHRVRSDAEFFFLHSIVEKKQSFWPDIKPFLETLSKVQHENTKSFTELYIVDYLENFWREFPCEASVYLYQTYINNPQLMHGYHRSREAIELIGTMYQSGLLTEQNQKNIMEILLGFIKAGWPEASMMLKKLEGSIE